MSAQKESSLKPGISVLGIVAGGGTLPQRLIEACDAQGIKTFIVAFEGHTDFSILEGRPHIITRLGAPPGRIIKTLKAHQAMDLVLIGSLSRPHISELRPDLYTARLLWRLSLRAFGDSDFLSLIRAELEREGFRLHGVHKFVHDLLVQEGPVGEYTPSKADLIDIERGMEISQKIGALDVGQSVIVQAGIVLGVEAVEGTDELIRRCASLKRKGPVEGRGGVLVKTCKPQQDRDFDLPTIGPDTVKNAAEAGLAGIAVHAGDSLLVDAQKVAETADRHKMFVIGLDVAKHRTGIE